MENGNFKLIDLNDVPLNGTDEEGKSIRNYMIYPTYSSTETIWPYGNVEDMFKWTYQGANSVNSITGNKMHAYFKASEELLGTFEDYDLRLKRYIVQAPVGDANGTLMEMPYGKVNVGTNYYLPENATGVFGRCLRLSEAYLNYAEAMAMAGNVNEATAALNALREKRFDPEDYDDVTFASRQELIDFIRDERRRELCFEGHRWFDLRRWGMPSFTHEWYNDAESTHTYRLEDGDLLYTVPIPEEALQMNSSLEQNELPGKRLPLTE